MAVHRIPIREMKCLDTIARRAIRAGDVTAIDRVNERLADVNLRLIARDGRLYVEMITKEQQPHVRNTDHA